MSLQLTLRTPRVRRLLAVSVLLGSAFVGTRFLTKKLLLALLYHPSQDPRLLEKLKHYAALFKKQKYRLEMVDYELPAENDGKKLEQRAILVHPEEPPTGLWVTFVGNAMLASDMLPFVEGLMASQKDGARPAFLLFDYPGYGTNSGSPSPTSILHGSLAAVSAALPLLSSPPPQLHLFGHSLGAAAASQLACAWSAQGHGQAGAEPGCLVLSAPFTSIVGMAQVIARLISPWLLPPAWLLRPLVVHNWENRRWVPQAAAAGWNVRIMHGNCDEIVPFAMGKSLQESLRQTGRSCEFVEVKSAGHNDLLSQAFEELVRLMEPPPPKGRNSSL